MSVSSSGVGGTVVSFLIVPVVVLLNGIALLMCLPLK